MKTRDELETIAHQIYCLMDAGDSSEAFPELPKAILLLDKLHKDGMRAAAEITKRSSEYRCYCYEDNENQTPRQN